MSDREFDAEAYVDAAAAALVLPIPASLRAGVIAQMRATHAIARVVMELPLPDEAEAAPVFRA